MKNKLNLLIAAGGTGGHLFPAVAVLEQLEELTDNNINAVFVGTSDRIESRVVPDHGYELVTIPVKGFSGLSPKTLSLPFRVILSIQRCRKLIRERKIDFVICTGAYISYPAGLAASLEKKKLFIMESNVSPGKTIRMLAGRATNIFTSFKETEVFFAPKNRAKVKMLGNPVRRSILKEIDQISARDKFELQPDMRTVLVFGGSLGARAINLAIEKSLDKLSKCAFQMLWQTGVNYTFDGNLPENIKMVKFIEDMASAYAAADLVVSRSGATSVAEICCTGKPSILIPLPTASNNEQALNALALLNNNAAILLDNSKAEAYLADLIISTLSEQKLLEEMGNKAKALGRPDAGHTIADFILSGDSIEQIASEETF